MKRKDFIKGLFMIPFVPKIIKEATKESQTGTTLPTGEGQVLASKGDGTVHWVNLNW